MATTLIRGATCVLPDETLRADVLLEGDRIARVDAPSGTTADETIDASGLHLLPGVVDSHVHFRDPGVEHKEDLVSGSRAAAAGGVTTFMDMPNVKPETTTVERLHARLDRAAGRCRVNYGFYIAATPFNLDELKAARRTPGIKIFIGSSTGDLLVDDQDALERIFAETTLPICAHCEDEDLVRERLAAMPADASHAYHSVVRDEEAAVRSVARAIDLAHRHRHRFHVLHVSTAGECRLIADAASERLVSGEACPHHLHFTVDDYERLGAKLQVNPAVKTSDDVAAVWAALRDGTLQAVVTDHAPHLLEEKAAPYPRSPSGLPAVENSLSLMLERAASGDCTLEQVVRWMCEAPARCWDMVGKGRVAEGEDADLVLVDLGRSREIRDDAQHTRCGWSPWHGTRVRGVPVRTIVGGRTVYDDGTFDESVRGREVRFDHERGGWWGTESS